MLDELLNFIMELDALLSIVAMMLVVQAVFVRVLLSRGVYSFLTSRSHPFINTYTLGIFNGV